MRKIAIIASVWLACSVTLAFSAVALGDHGSGGDDNHHGGGGEYCTHECDD